MENKRFHLQLIENVIERMAKNSFIIKGWTLTALGGLATLFIANQDKKWSYDLLILILICTLIFWWHDAYYLKLERQYRALYKIVSEKDPAEIDFSMLPPETNESVPCVALRPVLRHSYGIIVLIVIILLFILK